jgi:hypothetical protein
VIAPVLVAALALSAPAAPKKGVVPLVKLGAGVPASWQEPLVKAAQNAEPKGGQAWVAPPAVSLDDAQAALGCATWNDACAAQVASMTGAGGAFLVEVKAVGGGGEVVTRFVNEKGGARGTRKLKLDALDPAGLELARAMVGAAAEERDAAYLLVDSDTPGADVKVDGQPKGKTPWPRPIEMSAGAHTVLIAQEGRAPLTFEVTLAPFEIHRVTKTLGAAGPDKAPDPVVGTKVDPPTDEPRDAAPAAGDPDTLMYVGFATAGVGGLIAIVGLGFTTAWGTGYIEASQAAANKTALRRCVGLCSDDGIGLGISGGLRDQYRTGGYGMWLGGSLAALGVGALVTGIGLYLALGMAPEE